MTCDEVGDKIVLANDNQLLDALIKCRTSCIYETFKTLNVDIRKVDTLDRADMINEIKKELLYRLK